MREAYGISDRRYRNYDKTKHCYRNISNNKPCHEIRVTPEKKHKEQDATQYGKAPRSILIPLSKTYKAHKQQDMNNRPRNQSNQKIPQEMVCQQAWRNFRINDRTGRSRRSRRFRRPNLVILLHPLVPISCATPPETRLLPDSPLTWRRGRSQSRGGRQRRSLRGR